VKNAVPACEGGNNEAAATPYVGLLFVALFVAVMMFSVVFVVVRMVVIVVVMTFVWVLCMATI